MHHLIEIFQEIPTHWRIALAAMAASIMAYGTAYAFWIVHKLLARLSVFYACRRCRRMGLSVQRTRWQPEIGPSGIKTEFTTVQLDCLDSQRQRRLVMLSAWLFGVRKLISNEAYPQGYDLEWPKRPN